MSNASTKKKKPKSKPKSKLAAVRDRHLLYSAAVQSPEADLDFFERVYKRKRGERFRVLREDFCGTAVLSCEWVKRRKRNIAHGLDLDEPTLAWSHKHYVPVLGEAADRLHLRLQDVLLADEPKAEVVAALNFSYNIFHDRSRLRDYFAMVRRSMMPGGMFFLDAFGGSGAMDESEEDRTIPSSAAFDGTKVPKFTYEWEQARFNPIDHRLLCHIHFRPKGGKRIKRAFTYDWRLWTLPELGELLLEAGFSSVEFYTEGWDEEEDDTDGIFRKRKYFENQEGWVAYVVGLA